MRTHRERVSQYVSHQTVIEVKCQSKIHLTFQNGKKKIKAHYTKGM